MKAYELTYIVSSGINSEEVNNIAKEIESFIQNKEGVILKSEKTAAQTLSYPIKKHSSGYFFILTFQILENKIKEIKEKIQKEKQVLRHFVIIKKPIEERKERRMRKPLATPQSVTAVESAFNKTTEDKNKGVKVELEEIEKKLDEILNE